MPPPAMNKVGLSEKCGLSGALWFKCKAIQTGSLVGDSSASYLVDQHGSLLWVHCLCSWKTCSNSGVITAATD